MPDEITVDNVSDELTVDTPPEEVTMDNRAELVCTCNDEFATDVCPTHPNAIPTTETPAFRFVEDEEEVYIVTDEHVSPELWVRWEGWVFNCPICKAPSIMVNKDMNNRCVNPACGVKVKVNSKIVTDYIRHNIIPDKLVNRQRQR